MLKMPSVPPPQTVIIAHLEPTIVSPQTRSFAYKLFVNLSESCCKLFVNLSSSFINFIQYSIGIQCAIPAVSGLVYNEFSLDATLGGLVCPIINCTMPGMCAYGAPGFESCALAPVGYYSPP